jgi:hypothetical protein
MSVILFHQSRLVSELALHPSLHRQIVARAQRLRQQCKASQDRAEAVRHASQMTVVRSIEMLSLSFR